MLPSTTRRVQANTSDSVNDEIRRTTEQNIARFARRGRQAIQERLQELEEEWDIERTLEANAASLTVLGTALGALVDRRFFVVPMVVGGFLLMHALQGWCPPVPLFRRKGIRTQSEIDEEKFALKALRGDFRDVHPPSDGDGWLEVRQAYRAARQTGTSA